ncbi:Sorbin and SH3 domain-containing protein 1 [Aphis craccivora]|uniref:Sorbin and SH3 domain-containing protein 1 n=1 Tax=Aphis craccivora TaxID=307492 RepID=A0A6G0Z1E6_APHCR|nr:Sorbin and SH3 domain-containing protein 1 [Aphis craccivora]
MLVDTISDAHVHFHYSSRRFRDVLLANILATQNKNKVNNAGKAAKSGVREGFLIESINSASVDHLTSNEAQALIKNSGDTLTIGVYRQSKSSEKNDQKHEAEAKADKSVRTKQTEAETPNKKSKRVRKRRRKKKRADSPEKLNGHHPKTLLDKTSEQTKVITQITESPKIQIIPSNSDSRVDESEWIKQNEALLIADLKTRQQAGLPIQVVVRVEKITPSVPEYCQIIPDFCHLDVIREETSASDDDPKKETCECSEKIRNENNFKKLHKDWSSDVNEEENNELENSSEFNTSETIASECQLKRLESPSLVRESDILRFVDIVTTENECVIDLETLEPK